MKSIISMLVLLVALISFNSCKKEIYGCMDVNAENYSPVANKDAQNCSYAYVPPVPEDEVLVSNTLYGVSWTQMTSWWEINLSWPEITQSVIDNGAVSTYLGVNGEWVEIPVTFYIDVSYSSTISAYYSAGTVRIEWVDSDGVLPLEPDPYDFKLVIFK